MMLLAQALQGMSAPKKKRLSIMAPSGQMYQGAIEDQDDGPSAAQQEGEPLDAAALLSDAIAGINKPRRKLMSIEAPSGQVYQGEIADDAGEEPGAVQ
jgi:hypothetical protein